MAIDTGWLRARVDLLGLIGQDTPLRKVASTHGGEYAGPCPFCNGTDRLRVQPERGLWWCRQQGDARCRSGVHWQDAIAYVMLRDGLAFPQACDALGLHQDAPLPAPPQRREEPQDDPPSAAWQGRAEAFIAYARKLLWSPAGERARAYLQEQRGLTEETIHKWELGFNPSKLRDRASAWGLEGRPVTLPRGIVIPCRAGGETWSLKVRRPLPGDDLAAYLGAADDGNKAKYLPPRGAKPALFGADTLHGRERAVLVEGEFDAMLLDQEAGNLAGVATLGSACTRPGGRWLWYLAPVKQIYVAYDLDQPGAAGAAALAALSERVLPISPLDAKDLTAMHQAGHNLRAWLGYQLDPLQPAAVEPAPPVSDTPAAAGDVARDLWEPEMARLVAWFRRASFPDGPWQRCPGVRVEDPEPFLLALWREIKAGPRDQRARSGALQADLARLHELFGME